MQKISSIVLYILIAITVVLGILFYVGPTEVMFGINAPSFTVLNLVWAAVLLALAVVVAFLSSIVHMIMHPKVLVRGLLSIGIVGIVFFIAYFLAPSEPMSWKDVEVSATTAKWVSTGLNLTYILGGLAIFGMIFSEVYRAFK